MGMLFNTGDQSGATFSVCRKYRWTLWRTWDASKPTCTFIGLNPSTADETKDDPTIRRCINFAKRFGCGRYVMLNAYGFRATDPKVMKSQEEPVGDGNDDAISQTTQETIRGGGIVVAAWGVHCKPERAEAVCELVDDRIYCLGRTKARCPKHPLYLRKDTNLELFWEPTK